MQHTIDLSPLGTKAFKAFKAMNDAIASATGQISILKPEISILLELYEAGHRGIPIKASVIGLASGIPQTTSIRYLRYLEEWGSIIRRPHPTDQRVTYVELAPALMAHLDKIFLSMND